MAILEWNPTELLYILLKIDSCFITVPGVMKLNWVWAGIEKQNVTIPIVKCNISENFIIFIFVVQFSQLNQDGDN